MVQDAVAGYRLIKLVAAMPTSTVYAIDTIVAEMTILSIFASLAREGAIVIVAPLMFRCDGRHTCGVKCVDQRGDRRDAGRGEFLGLAEYWGPCWV